MIRRPPRSTLDRSSAASDVYKRQNIRSRFSRAKKNTVEVFNQLKNSVIKDVLIANDAVSYTHLRAHETVLDLVCRLLLEKKKKKITKAILS